MWLVVRLLWKLNCTSLRALPILWNEVSRVFRSRRATVSGWSTSWLCPKTKEMNTTDHRPVLIVIAGPNVSGKTTITLKISKIISSYQKSIVNCKRCSALADRVYIYDNSIDDTDARILFRLIDDNSSSNIPTTFLNGQRRWLNERKHNTNIVVGH